MLIDGFDALYGVRRFGSDIIRLAAIVEIGWHGVIMSSQKVDSLANWLVVGSERMHLL